MSQSEQPTSPTAFAIRRKPVLPPRKPLPSTTSTSSEIPPGPPQQDVPPVSDGIRTETPMTTELAIRKVLYQDYLGMDAVAQVVNNIYQDIARDILLEPELFLRVRNLILNAPQEEINSLIDYFENSNFYTADEPQHCMDWVDLIKLLRDKGPLVMMRVLPHKITYDHIMYASVAQTMLNDPNLKTDAQRLSLLPPPGVPSNKSVFPLTPISFEYDKEQYQKDYQYRYWIGERTLNLTDTQTLEAFKEELAYRFRNRKKPLVPFVPEPFNDTYAEISYNNQLRMTKNVQRLRQMAENDGIQLNTTGWTRDPGPIGPDLTWRVDGLPKLPEMHTCVAGEHYPNDSIYILQTYRFPNARNWTTHEEIVRFPLNLPRVDAREFRQTTSPEVLFTDRFGVTMKGATQTPQCLHTAEHEIHTRSLADTVGYDHTLASHGLTYEDYRRLIVGTLEIFQRQALDWRKLKDELRQFFFDATEHLRFRGVPVVVKFKFEGSGLIRWHLSRVSLRHHPFGVPMRGVLGKRFSR